MNEKLICRFRPTYNMTLFFPLGAYPKNITSGFGWRTLFGKRQFHGALDFGAPVGTDVFAALPGKVIRTNALNPAGKLDGYQSTQLPNGIGADVEIEHENGFVTRYSHLSACTVTVGQTVAAGEKIGEVGTAGTGPHLHFELKTEVGYISSNHAIAVDPTPYL